MLYEETGEEEKLDAGLPVTQPDDPRSGGHFSKGTSKAPLEIGDSAKESRGIQQRTHPGSAGERSRVIIDIVGALHLADSENTGSGVKRDSPISNGLTAVAV